MLASLQSSKPASNCLMSLSSSGTNRDPGGGVGSTSKGWRWVGLGLEMGEFWDQGVEMGRFRGGDG